MYIAISKDHLRITYKKLTKLANAYLKDQVKMTNSLHHHLALEKFEVFWYPIHLFSGELQSLRTEIHSEQAKICN